jgi:hypothetical protein
VAGGDDKGMGDEKNGVKLHAAAADQVGRVATFVVPGLFAYTPPRILL